MKYHENKEVTTMEKSTYTVKISHEHLPEFLQSIQILFNTLPDKRPLVVKGKKVSTDVLLWSIAYTVNNNISTDFCVTLHNAILNGSIISYTEEKE